MYVSRKHPHLRDDLAKNQAVSNLLLIVFVKCLQEFIEKFVIS